jgi:DNA-binding beta-propeller fold protein YncE
MVLAMSLRADTVTAINPVTRSASCSVVVGHTPDTVAVSHDGPAPYVTNETGGTLSVLHIAPPRDARIAPPPGSTLFLHVGLLMGDRGGRSVYLLE